jgi:PKD repeat protein
MSANDLKAFKQARFPKINNAQQGTKSTPTSTYYIDYSSLAENFTANTGSYVWEFKSNPAANDTMMTKVGMALYYSSPAVGTPDSIMVFNDFANIAASTKYFPYPSSITIDSIFFFNTHVNNSGLKDSIEWNIVGLSGTGVPQLNTVKARGGVSTTTTLSPGGHWLGTGATASLSFAPNYTSTVPVGVTELYYAGASTDTFSQLIAYVDDGAGNAAQFSSLPFSFYNYAPFITNLARNTSITSGGSASALEDWLTVVQVTFTEPLTAGFNFSPASPKAKAAVTFTATSNDASATYSWDFGDGSALGSGANPAHTYQAAGSYTVTMTATSAAGTVNASKVVNVGNALGINGISSQFATGAIYPNPAVAGTELVLPIELSNVNNIATINVTNALGQVVAAYTQTVNNKVTFSTANLNEGIYFYSVMIGGQEVKGKFNIIK